ncbi:ABC transporter substrate-binding protein [Salicibibacter kimchii]|uniref:BMP family ABC transporter substrate-binding protein n=1 Tax=Salicibibacter kimchii TaxID=2099786 RepID=A0A345C1H7_9BACI|nr:ABC transporter substrate-binding protein [Salicibibacter kimchii]AXF57058.1 BMP family ABC transporter substrate-binding protein [Salicibibacter kimchii]
MKKQGMFKVGSIVLLTALLSACGDEETEDAAAGDGENGDTASGENYDIGVVQYADHPSLDQATEGFKEAIEEAGLDVTYDDQNASGDMNVLQTVADTFVGDDVDLIFANATPAAQIMTSSTDDIPIMFTSVTDPEGAELVDTLDAPGGNTTGTMDLHPDAISQSVELMGAELGVDTIGMVYNAGEQNSEYQVGLAEEAAEEAGMDVQTATVQTSADVQSATESLVGSIDAFYIITDNEVVSGLDSVVGVAEEEGLPLFVGELDSVEAGGFAGFGFSYYDIGYKTGEMAMDVLNGEVEPESLAVEFPPELELVFNEGAAERMDIEWEDSWEDLADEIINE